MSRPEHEVLGLIGLYLILGTTIAALALGAYFVWTLML